MIEIAEEALDQINEGLFELLDPGPLRTPARNLRLSRDRNLDLILETEPAVEATSNAVDHPPGTLRLSSERANLKSIAGGEADLLGVIPFSFSVNDNHATGRSTRK